MLGRDKNIGYASFESDSDIVEGIANVFPIFFFLVAALVCITTMTRMVEEQRTQIGILKALGYSEGTIMGKYLFYSGSAAMLGCGIGFLLGSYIFPTGYLDSLQDYVPSGGFPRDSGLEARGDFPGGVNPVFHGHDHRYLQV